MGRVKTRPEAFLANPTQPEQFLSNLYLLNLRAQLFTSLKADLRQDINKMGFLRLAGALMEHFL